MFGTTVLDAGNADFAILGHPLLNVAVFSSLFVLHGALLVLLVEPSGRLVAAVAGDARWRGVVVNVAAVGAAVVTATAIVGLGALVGWLSPLVVALAVGAVGLAVVDPDGLGRSRGRSSPWWAASRSPCLRSAEPCSCSTSWRTILG